MCQWERERERERERVGEGKQMYARRPAHAHAQKKISACTKLSLSLPLSLSLSRSLARCLCNSAKKCFSQTQKAAPCPSPRCEFYFVPNQTRFVRWFACCRDRFQLPKLVVKRLGWNCEFLGRLPASRHLPFEQNYKVFWQIVKQLISLFQFWQIKVGLPDDTKNIKSTFKRVHIKLPSSSSSTLTLTPKA